MSQDMPHIPEDSSFDSFDRRKDEASFRQLYRCHTPMLFALAVRMCGNRAEAEELTQEAWVRAVENHSRFRRDARYSTWLVGILLNCFRESARYHARAPAQLDEQSDAQMETVVTPFPAKPPAPSAAIDVERALSQLAPGFREVVILHDLNGYTHQEIAEMLGIRPGTSKSQLMRGRRRLRELLTQKGSVPSTVHSRNERGTS